MFKNPLNKGYYAALMMKGFTQNNMEPQENNKRTENCKRKREREEDGQKTKKRGDNETINKQFVFR